MAHAKHEVLNQPPPLLGYNVFRADRALLEALSREGGEHAFASLDELGTLAGSEETAAWAVEANTHPPELRTHDRYGNRIDEVVYHPAYHKLMEVATRFGLHASPWRDAQPASHAVRAAKFFVWGQVEAGHGCPISMTYAAIPALRAQPEVFAIWEPHLTANAYDPALRPIREKSGALCGMAMTEKQGGSDVRANQTHAVFAERTADGDAYLLTGHKWFCSAPMSDGFLVLAQTEAGITCFLLPRVLPGGTRNNIFVQRLKDKLGNRSNASAEIELEGAWALIVGELGRGVQTIVEMVNHTRLDCINGSASLMRQALAQAIHHAEHRRAFGKPLVDQPLMRNVLADLALESEAATLLLMRLAGAVDRANDSRESLIKRLGTAIGKYYVCKRAQVAIGEALECLGGNGYVEESGMPRLYREAPVNSIWEGSGNINALDVLRILRKQPESLDAYHAEIAPILDNPRMRAEADALFGVLRADAPESQARMLCERLALLWQAALLAHTHSPLAQLFAESRVLGRWGRTLGTLPGSQDFAEILHRARPTQSMA